MKFKDNRQSWCNHPIMVQLIKADDKNAIFSNVSKLKGHNIYIREDFCPETKKKQAQLRPIFNLAKKHDKKTKFVQDKILYKGQFYGIDNISSIPLDRSQASCVQGEGVTIFKGEDCPLSNLYNIQFKVGNETYGSTEHHYQSKKCLEHGENELAQRVLKAKTGREAMIIGARVRPTVEWTKSKGAEIMRMGAKAKYDLEVPKQFLLSTKGTIGEGTRNITWGIGCDIHSDDALNPEKWKGVNLMGEILTVIRNEIEEVTQNAMDIK